MNNNGPDVGNEKKDDNVSSSIESLVNSYPELEKAFDMIASILLDEESIGDNEDIELEVVKFEKEEYLVLDKIEVKGTEYLFLANINDESDVMIKKISVQDGEECVVGLDSEYEFDLVYAYYQRKMWEKIKNKLSDNKNS